MAPFETRYLTSELFETAGRRGLDGMINISASFDGRPGDLLLATGSTDQSGTYVFAVEPQAVGPSFSKEGHYWKAADGFDTMFTLWNPTDRAEDFVVMFFFGQQGARYKLPVTLGRNASTTIDVSRVIARFDCTSPIANSKCPCAVKIAFLMILSAAALPRCGRLGRSRIARARRDLRALLRYMQCFSTVFVVMWSTPPVRGAMLLDQKSRDPSAVVVHDIHIHEYGVAGALRAFAEQQRIVIGYDGIYDGFETMGKQRTIRIDESTSTVANVLNKIVTQASGYAWKVSDSGAIHVYTIDGRVSLVDVQPANFVIAEKDRREIWESLEQIPELMSWLGDRRCTRGEIFNGFEWRQNMKKVSLDTNGKSLGRILDDVAGVTGTYFWQVFQYTSNGNCVVGIYLW